MPPAPVAALARDLVLDRYRPLRPLGSGGSGSVWLARDERSGREVALKIVAREGKAGDRAEREARAAARLRHERCVRAYGFGGDAGHFYIAYEYVPGRTLREAIRAGELTDRQAVAAAAQLLDALAHAHAHGIVHRDVKPANVILEEGERVSVRLLDFGLAQFDEAATLTAAGDVPGTLAYISPERLRGADATPAADVWSVGVILWETLAGGHPFLGVPIQQMAAAIAEGAPPLARERPDLPPRLLTAVDRALDLDPARRPSAAALAKELRRAWSRGPGGGRTPSLRTRGRVIAAPARLIPAAATGVATVAGASLLPFFPTGLAVGAGAIAAALAVRAPRAGLAVALAAPVLPLGNHAAGAAWLYAAVAIVVLAVAWRDARAGLAFAAGPPLAAVGALPLLPLVAALARGPARRAAHAALGVLAAALAARVYGESAAPGGIAAEESPAVVAGALLHELSARPELLVLAAVLAGAAALVPHARTPWRAAGLAASVLAAALLGAPALPAAPVVLGCWALAAALAARPAH
jgi:predicted Ser/Thr protein kinase